MPTQFSCLAAAWDLVPSPHLGPAIAPLDELSFFYLVKIKNTPKSNKYQLIFNNIVHPIEKVHNSNESTKW